LLLLALLVPRAAVANKNVGVLVTGEYLKTPTTQQLEKWLGNHDRKVVTNPMPGEAVKTLLDCFVLDDPKCMRSIVDARSTTPTLVSVRIDIASKKKREVRLTIDWFAKGHAPVSARRTCEECTEAVLRTTIDAMLDDLSKTAPGFHGALKITSNPAGITVLLNGKTIGVTPLETTVLVGTHKLQTARDGRTGPEKTIEVDGNEPIAIDLEVPPAAGPQIGNGGDPVPPPPPGRRSRLIPGLMIGIGLAGIGAGAALYFTSEEPTGDGRTYRDSKNLGIGVAAGGGALLLTGVIIILATKSTTGPTVSLTPGGGAAVGWSGSF
jgi:hypothetical protein